MIGTVEEWMKGRKTYLLMILTVIGAGIAGFQGWLTPEAGGIVGAFALMLGAVRGGIGKILDMLNEE